MAWGAACAEEQLAPLIAASERYERPRLAELCELHLQSRLTAEGAPALPSILRVVEAELGGAHKVSAIITSDFLLPTSDFLLPTYLF